MAGIFSWSSTAGSNTTVDGVSIAEGMAPSGLNNAIRGLMKVVRDTFSSSLESFFLGSALPIANGGTAASSASGALASLGALSSTYRDLPVTAKTGAFTLADADRGSLLRYSGGAASLTINPNGTTAITTGGVIVVVNRGSGTLTTAKGVGVSLYLAGTNSDANVSIPVGAVATFTKTDTNEWLVGGSGVTP